jgi:hypothetical protein
MVDFEKHLRGEKRMAFAEGIYDVTITKAGMAESEKGTVGLQVELKHETCGTIFHTIWLTPKTKERAAKTLAEFGVTADVLASADFWDDPGAALVGQAASITCENEEYPEGSGKVKLRARWLNGPNQAMKAAASGTSQRLADLFSNSYTDVPW